jgi:hypothetical protein
MSYDECKSKYIDKIMKEFKSGELKLQNNKKVTDKKQAIAIAINLAQRKCIMKPNDIKKITEKIMMFLSHDERKISETRIPLTDVIETRILIKNYLKMKDYKNAHKLEMLLVRRITLAALQGIKVSKNIWEELNIIQKML